jgi:hypothetical protein
VGGRAGRPKSYRHKIFGRTKKVVTGQSQITHFLCFKSILAYPRFTQARKMLLNVAYEATVYATMFGGHWDILQGMNGRHWWRWYSTIIIFSNFEPNIFG